MVYSEDEAGRGVWGSRRGREREPIGPETPGILPPSRKVSAGGEQGKSSRRRARGRDVGGCIACAKRGAKFSPRANSWNPHPHPLRHYSYFTGCENKSP